MRRSTLEAFNLEEDSNPSPSNAKAAEESLAAREHRTGGIHRFAQGTGRADPSNMAELTFQQRCDMTTGIFLELDTLGETLVYNYL